MPLTTLSTGERGKARAGDSQPPVAPAQVAGDPGSDPDARLDPTRDDDRERCCRGVTGVPVVDVRERRVMEPDRERLTGSARDSGTLVGPHVVVVWGLLLESAEDNPDPSSDNDVRQLYRSSPDRVSLT